MENIFISVLNMSITASYFVIALILLRLVFKKTPKWISCILWGLVGLRLVFPFSFESILSLVPSTETIPSDIMYQSNPHITSGIPALNSTLNPIISESFAPKDFASVNPLQVLSFISSAVWLLGIAVMLVYTGVSFIILKRKTAESIKTEKGVYICDAVDSPFILGVIRPKIYLPSNISDGDREFIVSHEKAHIKRGDHLWKPLGFLMLCVYWFNPLLWVAYILLCKDIEAACDERVLKEKGADIKKRYSETLLNFSSPKKLISACPLAFGETGVKQRIKNILSYKKPALWIIITAVLLSAIISVCFISNPRSTRINDIEPYESIFDNVTKLQFYIGNAYINTTEDISKEIRELKKVKLEKTPLDESRDYNRDKSYRVEIDDKTSININESFTELWLDDGIKPSYSYKITNPEILKNLFSASNFVTQISGIYVTINEVNHSSTGTSFDVTWHNERDEDVTIGEFFSIEKNNNDTWETVPFPENFAFPAIGYLLSSHSEKNEEYYCPVSLSEGNYRFSSSFHFNGKSYYARSTFSVGDNISEVGGADGPTVVLKGKKLTLEDVIRLSEKKNKLSWKDFEDFSYTEAGSGLYIRSYNIDDRFSLVIGGTSPGKEPMYIYLTAPDGAAGNFIDIRTSDVEEFIEENKNNPIPIPELSYNARSFPVDITGNNLDKIINYGAYVSHNLAFSSIKYLPVVRIESENELNHFCEHFEDTFEYNILFEDMALTFSQSKELYTKGFFEENNLLVVYVSASDEKDRFEPISIFLDGDSLFIGIREKRYKDAENTTPTGWLIVYEVPSGPLNEITQIEAYISNTQTVSDPERVISYLLPRESDGMFDTYFHLFDDGTFSLFNSPYSVFITKGTYKYEGDLLILTSYDEIYRYVFEVNTDYVLYKAENSIPHKDFMTVADNAKFQVSEITELYSVK